MLANTPTSTWQPVDKQKRVWVADYKVPNFKTRSVAIVLDERRWMVISPGEKVLEDVPSELTDGRQAPIILVPNYFHHMGVTTWRNSFGTHTRVFASPRALPRLHRLGLGPVESVSQLVAELPSDITILTPEGSRCGELWVRLDLDGRTTWIICDAFFNYDRLSRRFTARQMQRITRAAPGLQISSVAKWVLLDDRHAFKQWTLKQIEHDHPTGLIPSHGELTFDDGLPARIRSTLERRL